MSTMPRQTIVLTRQRLEVLFRGEVVHCGWVASPPALRCGLVVDPKNPDGLARGIVDLAAIVPAPIQQVPFHDAEIRT